MAAESHAIGFHDATKPSSARAWSRACGSDRVLAIMNFVL
jgi:hypothetical protein